MVLVNTQVSSDFLNPNFQELLNLHFGENVIDYNSNLSVSQKNAFELFKEGKSLLILGQAGTGKSKLIKTMEEYTRTNTTNFKKMHLCSTTGISAYNIGGVTIHSFMGVGTGDLEIDALIKKVSKKKVQRERILNTDILVIDEISMLSANLFEKLNAICQSIRKNNSFFGGIQVVFTGDVLQLLCVFNKNTSIYKNIDERLIVESQLFNNTFNNKKGNIITLTENFRQKDDIIFIDLLSRIRNGTFTKDDVNLLNTRVLLPEDTSNHLHLVTTNKKAIQINEIELAKIKTKEIVYKSIYNISGNDKDTKDILTKEIQFQFTQKGLNELTLKVGARVMLIKNLDVSIGLVNGALGTITKFIQDENTKSLVPFVEFDNKTKIIISTCPWELEMDNCKVIATQIPLMLAYSITIHKSQSLSMDSAILDLSNVFCDHLVYTALSRLRSLNGIYMKSFDPSKITVNKKMKDFLEQITLK